MLHVVNVSDNQQPRQQQQQQQYSMSSSPYQPAAKILNDLWENRKNRGLKSLLFDTNSQLTCSPATYAQVCQVQKNYSTLQAIQYRLDLSSAKNQGLLYVLLYELLLGPHQSIRGGGSLKRILLQQEDALRKTLAEIQQEQQIGNNNNDNNDDDKNSPQFPRYVRVNTWQATTAQVVRHIQKHYPNVELYADPHVPDLLVLPTNATAWLQQDEWLASNKIVLQDKSSCFSALCLVHGFEESDDDEYNDDKDNGTTATRTRTTTTAATVDWMDACAAPGNKTSHLAALIQQQQQQHQLQTSNAKTASFSSSSNNSTIYAFDRDATRCSCLERRMEQLLVPAAAAGASKTKKYNPSVVVSQQDFLQTKPADYSHVRGILLDPTCSGSGIFTSLERQQHDTTTTREDQTNSNNNKERLQALANFQTKALLHAMSFPSVERIVYSTCSLHVTENEQVIARVLSNNRQEWQIVAPHCLTHWKRRGRMHMESPNGDDEKDEIGLSKAEAACLIRVDRPDETNGFFVCCLQRRWSEKKRKNSKQPVSSADPVELKKQAKAIGLELYKGQFSSSLDARSSKAESKKRKTAPDSHGLTTTFSKAKRPASVTDDQANQKRKSSSSSAVAAGAKSISKKIAKKLEWKKRQREKKEERIRKKEK